MPKKYLLLSGIVDSKFDRDEHYISADKLCKLYNLNKKECFLANNEQDLLGFQLEEDMIILQPRYNGDYQEYLNKEKIND